MSERGPAWPESHRRRELYHTHIGVGPHCGVLVTTLVSLRSYRVLWCQVYHRGRLYSTCASFHIQAMGASSSRPRAGARRRVHPDQDERDEREPDTTEGWKRTRACGVPFAFQPDGAIHVCEHAAAPADDEASTDAALEPAQQKPRPPVQGYPIVRSVALDVETADGGRCCCRVWPANKYVDDVLLRLADGLTTQDETDRAVWLGRRGQLAHGLAERIIEPAVERVVNRTSPLEEIVERVVTVERPVDVVVRKHRRVAEKRERVNVRRRFTYRDVEKIVERIVDRPVERIVHGKRASAPTLPSASRAARGLAQARALPSGATHPDSARAL